MTLFGGWLADSHLGKFKTVVSLTIHNQANKHTFIYIFLCSRLICHQFCMKGDFVARVLRGRRAAVDHVGARRHRRLRRCHADDNDAWQPHKHNVGAWSSRAERTGAGCGRGAALVGRGAVASADCNWHRRHQAVRERVSRRPVHRRPGAPAATAVYVLLLFDQPRQRV